jgi:hypothetical protein
VVAIIVSISAVIESPIIKLFFQSSASASADVLWISASALFTSMIGIPFAVITNPFSEGLMSIS